MSMPSLLTTIPGTLYKTPALQKAEADFASYYTMAFDWLDGDYGTREVARCLRREDTWRFLSLRAAAIDHASRGALVLTLDTLILFVLSFII